MAAGTYILNDNFDLNRDLPPQELPKVKQSFLHWPPRKELLWQNTTLYRFVPASDQPLKQGKYSPYWIRKTTLDEIGRYHNDTKVPVPELARSLLSVAFDFKTTMDSILEIRLKTQVYAFVGPARPLPVLMDPKKRTDLNPELHSIQSQGRLEQVYLPELTPEYVISHRHLYLKQWGSSTFLY